MTKVINLNEKRPHLVGIALCTSCKHEWPAILPVGINWLECPECGLFSGRLKYKILREDYPHFQCNCGNQLFYLTPSGNYCPECGQWVTDGDD